MALLQSMRCPMSLGERPPRAPAASMLFLLTAVALAQGDPMGLMLLHGVPEEDLERERQQLAHVRPGLAAWPWPALNWFLRLSASGVRMIKAATGAWQL